MNQFDFINNSLNQAKKVTDKNIGNGKINLEELTDELLSIDAFKGLNTYLNSEENQKSCAPFEELNQKFILVYQQYKGAFEDLHRDIDQKAYRREYSKGGIGFHRGYYSPSHIDIVTRGTNRGRLLKKKPQSNHYTYEYVFDADDTLICVYYYGTHDAIEIPVSTELFVRKENVVQSFIFDYCHWDGQQQLNDVSECQYKDGRIMQYQYADCSLLGADHLGKHGNNCSMIYVETYDYEDNFIKSFHWYRYQTSCKLLQHDKFTFIRDENGKMSSFTGESIGEYQK